ncbi:MAG: tRNA (adenosine(37)-N6)-dimethylallyltransferase MiaA [Phycisphaerales bacterium]|nr:tRNA (adenosine(37)-N6)-dimethylallyltransferase MiaA [Phycisphaerales bacterium]
MPTPFPIMYGPTASGKSALALELHDRLSTQGHASELITADAFQVYRGMDIGTAKPTPAERQRVPHHLIDIADPLAPEPFTLEQWLARANAQIDRCREQGVIPIVVGGTSLYIQSLLHGVFEGPPANPELRATLDTLTPDQLHARLREVDPDAAMRIHPQDTRRATRAIEVFTLTGTPISVLQRQWSEGHARDDAKLFILSWPVEELNPRINSRVRAMINQGLLDEVRALLTKGELNRQAREALGYKQLLEHIADPRRVTLEDAIERVKIETRRFAKNQRTWMKRLGATKNATTLNASSMDTAMLAADVLKAINAAN